MANSDDCGPERYRVGAWEVLVAEGVLRQAGNKVQLTVQQMRLLQALIERRGKVTSRDQLFAEV